MGIVGKVRFRIEERFEVYGDPGSTSSAEIPTTISDGTVGPCEGPVKTSGEFLGTGGAVGAVDGAANGAGFVAGAKVGTDLANLILVAIAPSRRGLRD